MPQSTVPTATPPIVPKAHDCTDTPMPPRSKWYEAYHCPECDELTINTGYALYECQNCGSYFTRNTSAGGNNQCPECFRFAPKISDHACYECEAAEANEVWVYDCPVCDNLVMVPDQEAANASA